MANSSQSTGDDWASSLVTRRIAASRPRPASTQTTMRSSASGRLRKIDSARFFFRRFTRKSGTVEAQAGDADGGHRGRLRHAILHDQERAGQGQGR